jgi:hypothetical protein
MWPATLVISEICLFCSMYGVCANTCTKTCQPTFNLGDTARLVWMMDQSIRGLEIVLGTEMILVISSSKTIPC